MRAKFREIRINENLKPELIFTLNRLADNTAKLKGKIVDIDIKEAKEQGIPILEDLIYKELYE